MTRPRPIDGGRPCARRLDRNREAHEALADQEEDEEAEDEEEAVKEEDKGIDDAAVRKEAQDEALKLRTRRRTTTTPTRGRHRRRRRKPRPR